MKRIKRKDYVAPAPSDSQPWTPFERAIATWSAIPGALEGADDELTYANSRYVVIVTKERGGVLGDVAHLSIRHHDRRAERDWRDFQRIKNELCGPEYEAIELYPAESRLVDAANQFHLYVLLNGKVPVGFTDRIVMDGDGVNRPGHPCQRPFDPDTRPDDLTTREEASKMIMERAKR